MSMKFALERSADHYEALGQRTSAEARYYADEAKTIRRTLLEAPAVETLAASAVQSETLTTMLAAFMAGEATKAAAA